MQNVEKKYKFNNVQQKKKKKHSASLDNFSINLFLRSHHIQSM